MGFSIQMEHIHKSYGPVPALKDVSVEFRSGEVHAVVGENGAGKSTLMGVLAGFVRPERGALQFDGKEVETGSPSACRAAGIAMVHQHFMLVPEFTVEENLALGSLERSGFLLKPSSLSQIAMAKGIELGWKLDGRRIACELSVGEQQRLEILKALAQEARVLILDEPTAVLRKDETDELFRLMRHLASQGTAVLFVAHKLAEVLAVADRITVLRRGAIVRSVIRQEANAENLAEWMLGERPLREPSQESVLGAPLLKVRGLSVRGDRGETKVADASFEVAAGEILGIGGVDGNGQVELAEALAQLRPPESGTIVVPEGLMGFIPPDRRHEGLALDMSVLENMLIAGHQKPDLHKGALLDRTGIRAWGETLRKRFDIAAPDLDAPVRGLSGGNQQKVVVGRILDGDPRLLVAVNPTRGLDLKAEAFVHSQIRDAAQRGAAVVLFSTDLDELEALSHRQLFMSGGRLYAPDRAAYLGAAD